MSTKPTLAHDLALALDPAQLMHACGLTPDPWQQDMLRSTADRRLLLASRQSGKSATTACLALHTALYQPDSLVLLLSPSLRQSQELFKKVQGAYRVLHNPPPLAAESALRYEFVHGSRILALPGLENTVRGYSGVDLLIVDEAACVADDLYFAIRPMLAVSHGRLVALSTPFGKRGWFHHEYMEGQGWERIMITAYDCPRIRQEFLAEEQRSMPAMVFAAEYLCEFTDTQDNVFAYADIKAAISADVQPLFPEGVA